MNSENLERQKISSEILKNSLSCVALVIGGIWVLFVFYAMREAYLAEAKVADIESRNVALEISLEPKRIDRKFWEITVNLENKGRLPVVVNLQGDEVFTISKIEDIVSVTQVNVSSSTPVNSHNLITSKVLRSISSVTAFPGAKSQVRYLVELPESGVYFASFISEIPTDVLELINRQERGDQEEIITHSPAWMSQKYFYVGNDS